MLAVIFEVMPHPQHVDEYLDIAGTLKSDLEKIDGFISVERFKSLTTEGKILSLSFWRDENAIKAWRNQANHKFAQSKGRHELFSDYRLRVVSVIRDYGLSEREQAPADLAT